MRILIVNTDSPAFLRVFYGRRPNLAAQSYDEQMEARNASLYGVADFYSRNLRRLGHDAWDVHFNNEPLQHAWMNEHGARSHRPTARHLLGRARAVLSRSPFLAVRAVFPTALRRAVRPDAWTTRILSRQIAHYKPDVVLNHAILEMPPPFLTEIRPSIRVLVGQHAAAPLPDLDRLKCYDLFLSSFGPTLDRVRPTGIRTHLQRLAFEPAVLDRLQQGPKRHDVTFIGSFFDLHGSRQKLLESLVGMFPQLKIWGPGVAHLPDASPLRRCYVDQAWGSDMYQITRDSSIVLNHHGDVAPYANNLRLYEATGVGALLLTDAKPNLPDILEPGREVATYATPEECAEKIAYYLARPDEAARVARAGQERTLRNHTFHHRMKEFSDLVERLL